jgi:hypothetical protein
MAIAKPILEEKHKQLLRRIYEYQKRVAMKLLSQGHSIQEVAYIANWPDEDIQKLKDDHINEVGNQSEIYIKKT